MSIKTSVEKMSRDIGFDIGNSDDIVQANLLNGFTDALSTLSRADLDMQLIYIADKLSSNSIRILNKLVDFLEKE